MKRAILSLAAIVAGCKSSEWSDPQYNQPLVVNRPAAQAKPAPAPVQAPKKDGNVTLKLSYNLVDELTAGTFEGFVQLIERTEQRKLTDYERFEQHLQIRRNGGLTTKNIGDHILAYCTEMGIVAQFPFVQGAEIRRTYEETIRTEDSALATDLETILKGNDDDANSLFAQVLHAVYDGSTLLGQTQVEQLKAAGKKPEEAVLVPLDLETAVVEVPVIYGISDEVASGYIKAYFTKAQITEPFRRVQELSSMEDPEKPDGIVDPGEFAGFWQNKGIKVESEGADAPDTYRHDGQIRVTQDQKISMDQYIASLNPSQRVVFLTAVENLGPDPLLDEAKIKDLKTKVK